MSKMYEGTINDIQFLEVFVRAASKKVMKFLVKKTKKHIIYTYIYIYIYLSLVIYSLSKIVVLHGLLESPNMRKCYQLLVCCVLTIKKAILVFNAKACPDMLFFTCSI